MNWKHIDLRRGFPGRQFIVAGVLVAIFVLAYWLVLKRYRSEGTSTSVLTTAAPSAGPDYIGIYIKLLSVDALKGEVMARIICTPRGSLTTGNDTLTKNAILDLNNASGPTEFVFENGKPMAPVEISLNMYDGQVMNYPFDSHAAEIVCHCDSGSVPPVPGYTAQRIPLVIEDVEGSISGFKIRASFDEASSNSQPIANLQISRAATSIFFSVFIMSVMWLLTLAVLYLTFSVLARRHVPDSNLFSFLSALLFAFPALRESQPGTPPIGTLSDVLAFFWAEVLIALCLVTLLLDWLLRRPK